MPNQNERNTRSHYAVLGVVQNATQAEIKAAWRIIAMRTHPDRTPNPALHEEYRAAAEAYDVLWHPIPRRLYDMTLEMTSKCARCGGTGIVQKQKGFHNRVSAPCPECAK